MPQGRFREAKKKPKTKKQSVAKAGCAASDLMCQMRAARGQQEAKDKSERACRPNDPLCSDVGDNRRATERAPVSVLVETG